MLSLNAKFVDLIRINTDLSAFDEKRVKRTEEIKKI